MTSVLTPDTAQDAGADRRARARAALQAHGLAAAVLLNEDNIEFATGYDIGYPVGIARPARCALLTADGSPVVWEDPEVLARTERLGDWDVVRRPVDVAQLGVPGAGNGDAVARAVRQALDESGIDGPVGVDELSVEHYRAFAACGVEVRDASTALREARRVCGPAEVARLTELAQRADVAIAATAAGLRPGDTAVGVHARLELSLIGQGARDLCLQPPGPAPYDAGELVCLRAKADGWEGSYLVDIARMAPCGTPEPAAVRLLEEAAGVLDSLLMRVRAGVSSDVLVHEALRMLPSDVVLDPTEPVVHGCGLGEEEPVVLAGRPADLPLVAGMVLSVGFAVTRAGAGTVHLREMVVVTAEGGRRLSGGPRSDAA